MNSLLDVLLKICGRKFFFDDNRCMKKALERVDKKTLMFVID